MTYSPDLVRKTLLDLLHTRDDASICPSEVARALAKERHDDDLRWREAMNDVHALVDAMAEDRVLSLSWKGKVLARRSGPYRIRRP